MEMKNEKYIVLHNLAGWAWSLTDETWENRLRRCCECIKESAPDAWLIGLSEVIPGTGNKYIKIIEQVFANYVVVLPKGYDTNYRSAINIFLINKNGYHSHSTHTLEGLEDSLLYNYLAIESIYGVFHVLNLHMPHTCNGDKSKWYQNNRKQLRDDFEEAVTNACNTYRTEPDIPFIIMTDANATPEDGFIKKLSGPLNPMLFNATKKEDRRIPTWRNHSYSPSHIDYIMYSMGSLKSRVIDIYPNEIIDTPINQHISDHVIIRGKIGTHIKNNLKF
jgi:hypothetical protein